MDKNPSVTAGDTGPIPGPGRFHRPRSNRGQKPQLLNLSAAATETHMHRACAGQQEKPPQREAHAPRLERSHPSSQL